MAEAEVIALKEALYKQAQSIQELYAELEEERKAAASGADEALSMIFRLQEERAMEKMEASQYKRMTEAKMLHAEESLAFLKEAMLEKEIEIATLKFQIQSYRQNMLRVGISNPDVEETKMFDTPRLSGSSTFLELIGSNDRVRRHKSMPSSWFDSLNLDMDIIDKNVSLIPTEPSIWSETGECSKQLREQRSEFFSNKPNHVEKVISLPVAADDKSKPNMRIDTFCVRGNPRNCSGYSQSNPNNLFKSNFGSIQINSKCSSSSCLPSQRHRSEHNSFSCSYLEKDSTRETVHSTSIQDIYEIPKSNYGGATDESCKSSSSKATMDEKQKAVAGSLGDDLSNRPLIIMQNVRKYPTIGKGVSMNSLQTCGITGCESDVEVLKQRVQQLENDQWIMKEEESKRNNEQLNLLRQMHGQLKIIQSQTKVSKRKQFSRQDEILLLSITEAMLSFAL